MSTRSRPSHPLRWRSRPALLVAGCLAAGIVGAAAVPGIGVEGWIVIAAIAGVCGGSTLVVRQRLVSLAPLGRTLAVGIVLVSVGGLRMAEWRSLPADHVAHLARAALETEVAVAGIVADHPVKTDRSVRFTITADSVLLGDSLLSVRGEVQIALWQPRGDEPSIAYPSVWAGERVVVHGSIRPPSPRRNPADFDYAAYLGRRGVYATLSATDSTALTVLSPATGVLDRIANGARLHVRHALERTVRHPDARAVLAALLLADRSRIDRATRDAFAETGLMHLLAISGLHILLVGMGLYRLLKPMLHRLRWPWRRVEVVRATLTLTVLGLYVVATGAPPSAVRALVMAALLIIGKAAERSYNALNALGVAACILLLARPTALFDAGFQLSFAAVGAIVVLMPVLQSGLPTPWITRGWRKKVTDMTLVSVAATLGTAPVLLFHFGQVPLAGLVLNLAAIPATGFTLGGGLLAVATAGWLPPVANLAGAAAEGTAFILLWISRTGAEWLGWTNVVYAVRGGWWLAAIVCGLLALALIGRPRHRWRLTVAGFACVSIGVWQPVWSGASSPALEVIFFDVGQGDAALLRLPNGRHVLVDAGLRDPFTDQGERTILPHLRFAGIDRLDAVVISHPHADHLGGLPSILDAVPVGRVIHNGHAYASDLFVEVNDRLAEHGVPSQAVTAGDTLALDPTVRIHVLSPASAPHPEEEANHGSVVLRVSYGDTSFLLTGDAEADAEAALASTYGDLLRSDVVKVAHHGSRTSSTPDFVRHAVGEGAPFAVVSVARRNVYGLPNAEALGAWDEAGATVLQTWSEGALWFRSDGETVQRIAWR